MIEPSSSSSKASPSPTKRRDFLATTVSSIIVATSVISSSPSASFAADDATNPTKTICVTGANGYIGLHCVSQLLQSGYSVRAAVRSATSESKTQYLSQIAKDCGASDKLSFTSIDLLDVNSMVAAAKGCGAMLHLASPFNLQNGKDPFKRIVEPAVAGATNAVRAAETYA